MSDAPSSVDDQKVIGAEQATQTVEEKEAAAAAGQYSAQKTGDGKSIQVRIYSPFNVYYDGPAFSVSAENETGPFDILPNHHNFITLLTACDLSIRTIDKGDQKIRISGGIMHVKANQAIVFLDV